MEEALQRLGQLKSELKAMKEGVLAELVGRKKELTSQYTRVLESRTRTELLRQALEASRRELKQEYEQLSRLEHSNRRREERLARVRGKDLKSKEKVAQMEHSESCLVARQTADELSSLRRRFIGEAVSSVFPIEVESLSQQDAGEDDYPGDSLIDCDSVMEVEGGWMLGGVHNVPTPHIRIVTAPLRADGDHSLYLAAAKEKRQAHKELAHTGVAPPMLPKDPHHDPYLSTPAALVYTAQFVELIAETLDVPLPYPLPRHVAISDYGNPDRRRRDFLDSVAKLNGNIIYLCFSQAVPDSALAPGHTLKNLLALVTHTQLGRRGAFTCNPTLVQYSSPEVGGADSEEPPTLSYTECHGNSDSDSDDGEWEAVDPPTLDVVVPVQSHERVRHLDYNSTYLDYIAMGSSTQSSVPSGQENAEPTGGLMDAISSLWSSTFSRSA